MRQAAHLARLLLLLAMAGTARVNAYPLDGYAETGIRRVEGARLASEGVIAGSKQPPGALLTTPQVDLRLLDYRNLELPVPDPDFTRQVLGLLGENAGNYGVAVLDITDPSHPRYAEHRGDHRQNVGSVGKLVVALALFQALADTWPDDLAKRRQILRETIVTADGFSHTDHHTIRLFDVAAKKLVRRPLRDGDQGSLWEYLDWALSASSNSAAAMVMREVMLLRQYGREYPPSGSEIQRFFRETPRKELTELFQRTFYDPVTRNGLDLELLRQGSFFTAEGKRRVPGPGSSYGTARELMRYILRMEQGRLVDEFSSREIKRLLYMTERRIRYASSPALKDAALYFKSGSLYSCKKEEGFKCGKYRGNVRNYMNSVAIVESPAGDYRLDYMVTLISNVLRKNSAVDHQTLATRIHRLIEAAHPLPKQEKAAPALPAQTK
jgi:Beta-lactamase enzyme family